MRFSNFCASCTGKVFTTILMIILGVVLTLGGIGLAGYILLSREGMVGTVEDAAQEAGLPIDFSEELEELSLLAWGMQVFELFGSINTAKIGDIEQTIGYSDLSKMIQEAIGVSADKIKEATLGTLGEVISDNLTLALAGEKFGITFPDLPVFSDPDFMNKSMKAAFADFNDLELQDLVAINEESSVLLKNLADLKVGDMSDPEGGLDDRINSMKLNEVITITEDSHNVLIKLQDTAIGELGSAGTDAKINGMLLGELMDIIDPSEPNGSTKVLWALRNSPLVTRNARYGVGDPIIDANGNWVEADGEKQYYEADGINHQVGDPVLDGENPVQILGVNDRLKILKLSEMVDTGTEYIWNYLGDATVETLGTKVDEMCIYHVVQITATSNAILRKMRVYDPDIDAPEDIDKFGAENVRISELDSKLIPIVQTVELGEIITIDEGSAPILKALRYTQVGDMNTRVNNLTVADAFTPAQYSTGVLSLIDAETTLLTSLPTELTAEIKVARLERLSKSGIITTLPIVLPEEAETMAHLRNQTIGTMMADYIRALKGIPMVTPVRIYLDAADTEIDPGFIDTLTGFSDGASLVLGADTVIKQGEYTKMFNVMLNGYNLTIENGVTFSSEKEDAGNTVYPGGYMFISGYSFDEVPSVSYDSVNSGGTVEVLEEDELNPGTFNPVEMTEVNYNDFGLVKDLSVNSAEITFVFYSSTI